MTVRPEGSRRFYQARVEGLDKAWRFIDELWADRLGRLETTAERIERNRGDQS